MGMFDSFFNGLGDDINSVFGSSLSGSDVASIGKDVLGIGSALGAGSSGQNMTDKGETQAYRGLKLSGALEQHTMSPLTQIQTRSPIHSRNEFEKTESVDPFTLDRQWTDRLATYAGIQRMTGVAETGK